MKDSRGRGITGLGPLPGVGLIETPEAFYDALHTWVSDWYKFHPRRAEHPWRLVLLFSNHQTAVYRFEGPLTKEMIFRAHQRAFDFPPKDGVYIVCAALVTEAWMRALAINEKPIAGVDKHPDRIECVLFNLLTRDNQAVLACPLDRGNLLGASIPKIPFEYLDGHAEGTAVRPLSPPHKEQP